LIHYIICIFLKKKYWSYCPVKTRRPVQTVPSRPDPFLIQYLDGTRARSGIYVAVNVCVRADGLRQARMWKSSQSHVCPDCKFSIALNDVGAEVFVGVSLVHCNFTVKDTHCESLHVCCIGTMLELIIINCNMYGLIYNKYILYNGPSNYIHYEVIKLCIINRV
jgi:hypothetical protein